MAFRSTHHTRLTRHFIKRHHDDVIMLWPAICSTRLTWSDSIILIFFFKSNFKIWKLKKKKKNCSHFILCFVFIFFFFVIFNIRRKKNWHSLVREKKNSNFEFSKKKKICGIYFFTLSSWAKIEPSLWATELRSRAKSFKIRASEPLVEIKPLSHALTKPSRVPNYQAKIRATETLSWDPSHRAEIRAKPSWVESFELYFVTKLKVSLK